MKHKIFESNPQLKQVHLTADGECFYNDNDAKMHAKSLEDKKVELVLNPDHLEVVGEAIEEASQEEATTAAPATEEASKEEATTAAPATEEASKEEGTTDAPATEEASKEEVSTAAPATEKAPKVVKPSKNTK